MSRVFDIARREYIENVRTKAFLIGLVLTPLWMGLVLVVPKLMRGAKSEAKPVVIVDTTGVLAAPLAERIREAGGFEVEIETTPQVELPSWDEIDVTPEPVIINQEQVDEALESLRQREVRFDDAEEGQGLDSEHAVEMDLIYLKDGEEGPAAEDIRLGLESPLYGVEEEDWTKHMDGVLPDATVADWE